MTAALSWLALSATACGSLPKPIDPAFAPRAGYKSCQDISMSARVRASTTSGWGWAFSIAGAGTAVTGATVFPLAGDLSPREKIVAGSLTAAGALLFAVGQAWIKRSDAASTLAGETASILGEGSADDSKAEQTVVKKCNVALGAWERSRTDASGVTTTLLQKQKEETAAARSETAASR
jgi:hypothetical protein